MNQFAEILSQAANQLQFPFTVNESEKSEACYLNIACYSNSDLNNIYSCLGVRLANHEAMTARSQNYEIQIESGFNFDYASKEFSTTWGIDEDGDFDTHCLEDEKYFESENEMIVYMANCLVTKIKSKI